MADENLRIEWGVSNVPHPQKGDGEDTWFIINDAQSPAAGVFDGVGAWADENVNPIYWSMAVADGCSNAIMDGITGPIGILTEGYRNAQRSGHEGSCTACIAIKSGPRSVAVANLGDSGIALYREGDLIFAMITDFETFEIRHKLRNLAYHINSELFPDRVPIKEKKNNGDLKR